MDDHTLPCEFLERNDLGMESVTDGTNEEDLLVNIKQLVNEELVRYCFQEAEIIEWCGSLPLGTYLEQKHLIEDWKRGLSLFFTWMKTFTVKSGLSERQIHETLLLGHESLYQRLKTAPNFWNFMQTHVWKHQFQYAQNTEFSELELEPVPWKLSVAPENLNMTSNIEEQDVASDSETASSVESNLDNGSSSQHDRNSSQTVGYDILSTPRKPASTSLGKFSQYCSHQYRLLKSPEKRKQLKRHLKDFEKWSKTRHHQPIIRQSLHRRFFQKLERNMVIAERHGIASSVYACDTKARKFGSRPLYVNHHSKQGEPHFAALDREDKGYMRWETLVRGASALDELGEPGGVLVSSSLRPQNPAIGVSSLSSQHRRDGERAKLRTRLVKMIEAAANDTLQQRYQKDLALMIPGQQVCEPMPIQLTRLPNRKDFDQTLHKWGVGLYLLREPDPGFRRADLMQLTQSTRRKGAQFRHHVSTALNNGSIRVEAENPFETSLEVECPILI